MMMRSLHSRPPSIRRLLPRHGLGGPSWGPPPLSAAAVRRCRALGAWDHAYAQGNSGWGTGQPGWRQPGWRQPGGRQPGWRQPGRRQPGRRQPGRRQPGAAGNQGGGNQGGGNQGGGNQDGGNQGGGNQGGGQDTGNRRRLGLAATRAAATPTAATRGGGNSGSDRNDKREGSEPTGAPGNRQRRQPEPHWAAPPLPFQAQRGRGATGNGSQTLPLGRRRGGRLQTHAKNCHSGERTSGRRTAPGRTVPCDGPPSIAGVRNGDDSFSIRIGRRRQWNSTRTPRAP